MFTLTRSIHTVGTIKMRSHSESRGVHAGGAKPAKFARGESWGCSVWQVVHTGGVFSNRGFTVLIFMLLFKMFVYKWMLCIRFNRFVSLCVAVCENNDIFVLDNDAWSMVFLFFAANSFKYLVYYFVRSSYMCQYDYYILYELGRDLCDKNFVQTKLIQYR